MAVLGQPPAAAATVDAEALANMFLAAMLSDIGGTMCTNDQYKKLGLRTTCLPEEVSWTKKHIGAKLHQDKIENNLTAFMESKHIHCSSQACNS